MNWITRPGWPGNLLAMAAGALTPLCMAPFDFWPLSLLSLGLLYLSLRELAPKAAMLRGWSYGFGLFGAGTSWIYVSIHDFGGASPLLAGGLMLLFSAAVALFFALPAWLWSRWLRNGSGLGDALAFAALWVAQEAFRGWFLTGFPWLFAGYSQLDGPLAGLAPLGGVWLIGFVLAFSAALLVNLPRLRQQPRALSLGLLLLLLFWGTGWSLQQYSWTEPAGKALSVAAVQGNVAQNMKWDPAQLNAQLALYRDLSIKGPRVDLLVWPETAVPVLKDYAGSYLQAMDAFANDRQTTLITGVPVREVDADGNKRFYNAITVIGKGQGTYLKQKLVPFGEYVPLQDVLRGLIAFFDLPMSDFARGPADQPLLQAQGYQVAAYICYEVVYPEFAAGLAAQSNLLLTVSNDAWFGHSIGPLQHLQMAQMRALEAGRWMIRATNTGVTALIDPFGQIDTRIASFEQGVLYGEVLPMQGLTPYLRWHSWPLTLCCGLLLLGAARARKARTAA